VDENADGTSVRLLYLHFGARRLVQRLRAHAIAHEHEEFDDGHMDIDYRYDVSLPKLARALSLV